MKTLILAALATLSIGAEAAFAETGDSYEWSQPMPTATTIARLVQPQAYNGIVIAHSATKSCDTASGLATSPQAAMPRSVAPHSDASLGGYPLNWGSG
jgi:hypothetical protein